MRLVGKYTGLRAAQQFPSKQRVLPGGAFHVAEVGIVEQVPVNDCGLRGDDGEFLFVEEMLAQIVNKDVLLGGMMACQLRRLRNRL